MEKIRKIIKEEIIKLTEAVEEKHYLWRDKTGRGEKPVKLTASHILKTWDLEETDWNDVRLGDYIENSYIGDVWETTSEKLECIGIY